MKKIALIFIACTLLLAGCWDERLYKEYTTVPLFGLEGEQGKWTGYFTYTTIASPNTLSYSTVEGTGASIREIQLDANQKMGENLDLSQLQVIHLSEEAAKSNISETFNLYYRTPHNRLSSRFVVVEGEVAPYMEKTEKMGVEAPDYYNKTLLAAISISIIPEVDIQKAARLLLDEGIDLDLPYMKISETAGKPEVLGVALFSDKVFTGHTLKKEEAIIVQVLKKKPGKYTWFTYKWEKDGKSYPITVKLDTLKKEWNIQEGEIDATYKMKFSVDEFPHDHLDSEETTKEVNKFLSKELTKDFNEVIKKLQEAKSDPIGFGRTVRAFHPHLWNKGKWQDTFSELDINVKVEAEITRSGILN